jgi:hypothetical protein
MRHEPATAASLAPHNYKGMQPPARLLADETLPTPEEARLIVQRWDEGAPCRDQFVAAIGKPPINRPGAAQIIAARDAAAAENVAHFGQGRMTWAAALREVVKIWQDSARQLDALDATMRQQAAQDAEVRRENAMAAVAILGATMPRPPQTIYVAPCTIYGQIAHVC